MPELDSGAQPRRGLWLAGVLGIIVLAYLPASHLYFRGDDFHWLNISYSLWESPWSLFDKMFLFFRPTVTLSLYLNYLFFGPNELAFNTITILLHLGNVSLLFWLLCRLTNRPALAGTIAVMYGTSPFYCEVTLWSAARNDSILLFFFLLTFLVLSSTRLMTSLAGQLLLFLPVLGALSTKENWLMLPPLILLFSWLVQRSTLRRAVLVTLVPSCMAGVYVVVFFVLPRLRQATTALDYSGSATVSAAVNKLGFLVLHYFRLADLIDGGLMRSVAALILILVLLFLAVRADNRIALFGIAFMFLMMLPTIHIEFTPTRFDYIPLLGFWLAVVSVAEEPIRHLVTTRAGLFRVVGPLLLCSVVAYHIVMLRDEIDDYSLFGESHRWVAEMYGLVMDEVPRGETFLFANLGTRDAAREMREHSRGFSKVVYHKPGGMWQILYLDELANFIGDPFSERMNEVHDLDESVIRQARVLVFTDQGFGLSNSVPPSVFVDWQVHNKLPPGYRAYRIEPVSR